MNERDRREWLLKAFTARFGSSPPLIWTQAPGQISLMGACLGSNQVLTLAIDRNTWLAARPRSDQVVAIFSLSVSGGSTLNLNNPEPDSSLPWIRHLAAITAALQAEGYPLTGFDGLIHSTIPVNCGLGSATALKVVAALAFQTLGGWTLDPVRLAQLCQPAETQPADILTSVAESCTALQAKAGCTLLVNCNGQVARPLPLSPSLALVICDSRIGPVVQGRHPWPDQPDESARLNQFVMAESQRVFLLAASLSTNDRAAIGMLTAAAYADAIESGHIQTPQIGAMMEAILAAPGLVGARQLGLGQEGCLVALVDQWQVEVFMRHTQARYTLLTGIRPRIYQVRAAPGAGQVAPETP